jgi:acetyl esterase
MALHPRLAALRSHRLANGYAPIYTLSVDRARQEDLDAIRATERTPEPVGRVSDREIPGPDGPVPIRVYLPRDGDGPYPVLVYFFGGGWVLGTVDTSDATCRALTNAAGCATVAVGYRLAPEHPFPAAVQDCLAALDWVAGEGRRHGLDADRLAVAGDSAGGNLAAVMTLLCRDRGGPALAAAALVYPNTDRFSDTPSMRENDDIMFFNRRSVQWYWDHYLSSAADGESPLVSPLRAESLADLPPTLMITAEHDPLRDEGELYAHRLRDSGVPVELTRYPGMVHGFLTMTGLVDDARQATDQIATFLRSRLAG